MIKKSEPASISMTAAIAQLRMGNLNDLSLDKLAALRDAIIAHPSITGFDGCADALERLDAAELQRSIPPQNTESSRPESNRKNWLPVVAGVAGLIALLLGIGVFVSWFRQRLEAPLVAATEQPPAVSALPATVADNPTPETPPENPAIVERAVEVAEQVIPTKITVKSAGSSIDFRGSINGNPHISINAPGGKVRFFQNVEGSATLLLDVPGGRVVFAGNETDQAALGGGVSVLATAETVEFSGGMDAGARADVTLGGKGTLRFSRLDGGSSISYRKADDSDPTPTVEGDLSGTGRLIVDVSKDNG